MWLLVGVIIWLSFVGEVVAQVREDAEVLLAPALEVFAGSGTGMEMFWVGVAVVGGGLVCALVAANVMWLVHRITLAMLMKFLGVWSVLTLGVSAVGFSWYVSQNDMRVVIDAEIQIQPLEVRVQRRGNLLLVKWRTIEPTLGQVLFRTDVRELERIRLSSRTKVTEHVVEIELVEGESEMWLSILSNGVLYREEGSELHIQL